MLNQLANHLEGEFDNLFSLVANSMILHADETSWSIRSVWAFVTESARGLLEGVHEDASTLEAVLNAVEQITASQNAPSSNADDVSESKKNNSDSANPLPFRSCPPKAIQFRQNYVKKRKLLVIVPATLLPSSRGDRKGRLDQSHERVYSDS